MSEALRDVAEGLDDLFIGGALEGHDEGRSAAELFPAPGIEFRLESPPAGAIDIELAVGTGKAEGKPALALAAIFATPGPAQDVIRQVIVNPFGRLGEEAHGSHA